MPTHALHKLQAAVREYAAHVAPGVTPRRVVILDASREAIADLLMNPCVVVQVAPVSETARLGWSFAGGLPKFDGEEVPVAGKPLAILMVLEAADAPMKPRAIAAKAWDKNPPDEGTVRQHVMDLRETLAKHFTHWSDEFIRTTPHGYQLMYR